MSAVALDRRAYQREVETLLEQIRRQVRELRRLYAAGVRGPGLAERKRALARMRERLAQLTRVRAV